MAGRIKSRPINDCGKLDIWPVLAESSTWGYGASGTYGFGTGYVLDRFHPFKHSDFFKEDNVRDLVKECWIPWLTKQNYTELEHKEKNTPAIWTLFEKLKLRWLLVGVLILFAGPIIKSQAVDMHSQWIAEIADSHSKEADNSFGKGELFTTIKHLNYAKIAYSLAGKKDLEASATARIAKVLQATGQFRESLDLLNSFVSNNNFSEREPEVQQKIYAFQGKTFYQLRDIKEAQKYYEKLNFDLNPSIDAIILGIILDKEDEDSDIHVSRVENFIRNNNSNIEMEFDIYTARIISAYLKYIKGEFDEARNEITRIIKITSTRSYDMISAEAYFVRAHIHLIQNNFDQAEDDVKKAEERFNRIRSFYGKARALTALARIYSQRGLRSDSEVYYEKAEALVDLISDPRLTAEISFSRAQKYLKEGKVADSSQEYQTAENIFRDLGSRIMLGNIYALKAELEIQTGNYDSARTFINKSEEVYDDADHSHGEWTVARLRARIFLGERKYSAVDSQLSVFGENLDRIPRGIKGEYHLIMGDMLMLQELNKKAQDHYQRARNIAITSNDMNLNAESSFRLGLTQRFSDRKNTEKELESAKNMFNNLRNDSGFALTLLAEACLSFEQNDNDIGEYKMVVAYEKMQGYEVEKIFGNFDPYRSYADNKHFEICQNLENLVL